MHDRIPRSKPSVSTRQSGPLASATEKRTTPSTSGAETGGTLESAQTLGHRLSELAVLPEAVRAPGASPLPVKLRPATQQPLQRMLQRGLGLFGTLSRVGKPSFQSVRPLFTATSTHTREENRDLHFDKHGLEFPEIGDSKEYEKKAEEIYKSPPEGTQTKVRKNGDTVQYHAKSNTFVVTNKAGKTKTKFKPDPSVHRYPTNQAYFDAQS